MAHAPTRAILFKDAMSKGLLKRCRPEIRELYQILEVDFHPLSICKRISPILAQIGTDAEMEKYVLPLQQVILTRLFQQLSQVYDSVKLDFVLDLAQFPEPFKVSSGTIEKFIMNGCKKGDLAIRIDHAAGVLTFDSDVFSSAKALHPGAGAGSAEAEAGTVQRLQSTPSEIVRSQLTRLAKSLFITCQYVDPSFNKERNDAKATALERAKVGAKKEHQEILARREVIDRKKQAASSALAQKEKDLATQKRLKVQEQQAAEAQRLAEEQRERDRRRLDAERQRVQQEEAQRALEELKRGTKNIDLGEIDVADLDTGTIRAIKIRALEKEKNDLNEKLRLTGRRVDHLERAFRREELKHIADDYTAQRESDFKAHEKAKTDTLRDSEQKHKDDVALKHRLTHLVPAYESFRDSIREQRKAAFEQRRKTAEQDLENKMKARVQEHRERRQREKREREEAERREREEEERLALEEEEKARADAERRERMLEEKTKRDEERKYVALQLYEMRVRLLT
jgi:translation initiation factor 3 subunit A